MARTIPAVTTTAANGPPPPSAVTLYVGTVMHARLFPFGHRFAYRVFSLLLDLDRLDQAGRLSALFSVDRPNITSFHAKDHLERPGESLRGQAERLLAGAGLPPPARILLMANPRVFGYVFNPISVYFCYGTAGDLTALIYAVRNTFGQRHSYVAPVRPGELGPAGIRQERDKLFHVSPFIGMDARYRFRVLPPGRTLKLRILETERGTPCLAATFEGEARAMTTASLAACLLKIPLLTWKIIGGIHWQALKLWLKGARFHPSPPGPEPASYGRRQRGERHHAP